MTSSAWCPGHGHSAFERLTVQTPSARGSASVVVDSVRNLTQVVHEGQAAPRGDVLPVLSEITNDDPPVPGSP